MSRSWQRNVLFAHSSLRRQCVCVLLRTVHVDGSASSLAGWPGPSPPGWAMRHASSRDCRASQAGTSWPYVLWSTLVTGPQSAQLRPAVLPPPPLIAAVHSPWSSTSHGRLHCSALSVTTDKYLQLQQLEPRGPRRYSAANDWYCDCDCLQDVPWPFERFAMLLIVSLSIKFVENVFPFFSGNQLPFHSREFGNENGRECRAPGKRVPGNEKPS